MENWITENSTAIIAGIISSVIVLLLQVFTTSIISSLTFFLTNRLTLSRIYGIKDRGSIYIASGELPTTSDGSNIASTIKSPDSMAANYIVETLQEIYKNSNIEHIYTGIDKEIQSIRENIICVGGPKHNSTTKHFLEYLPSNIGFDHNYNLQIYNDVYHKGENNVDYGLLAKIKNPYADDKYIFIVAGCGTHGVLASSYLITNQKYFPKLKNDLIKKLGQFSIKKNEFVAVVKCNTYNNEIANNEIKFIKRIKNGK